MRFFSENSMRVDRNSTTEKSDTFKEAKKKLIRRSPELEELIKEVKSWIIEEERAPWKNGKGKP
jgi:hypothetical protein